MQDTAIWHGGCEYSCRKNRLPPYSQRRQDQDIRACRVDSPHSEGIPDARGGYWNPGSLCWSEWCTPLSVLRGRSALSCVVQSTLQCVKRTTQSTARRSLEGSCKP